MTKTPTVEDQGRPSASLSPLPNGENDRLWDEIQSLWDEQSSRIDQALAAAGRPASGQYRPRMAVPTHIRLMCLHWAQLAVLVFAAIYWVTLIPSLAATLPATIVCCAIEVAYIILAYECFKKARAFAHSSPNRATLSFASSQCALRGPQHGMSAACIAAMIAIVVTFCAPSEVNGCVITSNYPDNTAVVEDIAQVLSQL